jgi:hypothetical protein
MFHPRSRNDQGDYCRQADLMSAQRLVCLRHDAGKMLCSRSWAGRHLTWEAFNQIKERTPLSRPKLHLPYRLQSLAVL